MRYVVKAYLCTNFAGLMDSLETDDFYEVQDFVWANAQKGYNCKLYDRETGERKWLYADAFNEETTDVDDLTDTVRDNMFYADLRMEQQEQM